MPSEEERKTRPSPPKRHSPRVRPIPPSLGPEALQLGSYAPSSHVCVPSSYLRTVQYFITIQRHHEYLNAARVTLADEALRSKYIPRQRLRPLQRPIAHFSFAYAKRSLERQEPSYYYTILSLNDIRLIFMPRLDRGNW